MRAILQMANNPPYSNLQPLQPPLRISMDPSGNIISSMPIQFQPVIPAQQPQQFIPLASPQLQHTGLPSHPPQPQYPQSVQQLPGQPVPGLPQSQLGPPSYGQPPVAYTVTQYQPTTHLPSTNIPVQPSVEQSSVTMANASMVDIHPAKPLENPTSDWKEHISANGRRYLRKQNGGRGTCSVNL